MAIVNLAILVEDCGDGELSPFVTSEDSLEVAREHVPDAVMLHHMTVADDESTVAGFGSKKQQLATTLNALMELGYLMDGCEIQDLFMKFFYEGMKAGMQYSKDGSSSLHGLDDRQHAFQQG
ncbi:MAG: hypothetical protein WAV98_00195 [Minisyncoccia bacterium]